MSGFLAFSLFDEEVGVGPMGPALRQTLILLGALVWVTALILFWAYWIRRRRRLGSRGGEPRRHRHHRSFSKKAAQGVVEIKQLIDERSRRRRRHHRPRNPTLAETGGLPPVRDQHSPPAPPAAPSP